MKSHQFFNFKSSKKSWKKEKKNLTKKKRKRPYLFFFLVVYLSKSFDNIHIKNNNKTKDFLFNKDYNNKEKIKEEIVHFSKKKAETNQHLKKK